MTDFRDLPDLASEAVGGVVIACSDESCAPRANLVRVGPAPDRDVALAGRDRCADGWETRRFRASDGAAPGSGSDVHDWCVVRLGVPGAIAGVVIDTARFRDNHPETAAVEGAVIASPLDLAELATATWVSLVPRSPIAGHAANVFAVANDQPFTHVRLAIYPDGGVARLRVHGRPMPNRDRLAAGMVDLAALENGAFIEACSDGVATNLIVPGRARAIADGWETRRRRGPGNDWATIALAATGTIERIEIDTSHFHASAPARIVVDGTSDEPGSTADGRPELDRTNWRTLLATPVQANTRHVFDSELRRIGDVSRLRLSILPCGGVTRLRAWGTAAPVADPGLVKLNAMTPLDATSALLRCSRSSAWAAAMTGARPFEDVNALLRIAERTWWSLDERDYLEAFAGHPRIGELRSNRLSGPLFISDQPEAAADMARAALIEANKAYEAKHGFIFIVCASGKTMEALLAELLARFERSRPEELRTAAEEQAKIIRLRLVRLLQELV